MLNQRTYTIRTKNENGIIKSEFYRDDIPNKAIDPREIPTPDYKRLMGTVTKHFDIMSFDRTIPVIEKRVKLVQLI